MASIKFEKKVAVKTKRSDSRSWVIFVTRNPTTPTISYSTTVL
jgi:hypothetical protein